MVFWEKWNRSWNFEKKIDYVIICTITVIAVAAIGISTFSFIRSVTDQNGRYVEEQLLFLAEDYADNLEQYKALATSVILDTHVQKYSESKTLQELYSEMGNVYSSFLNMLYIQYNANFIVVTNDALGQYLYNGNSAVSESSFETMYEKDYEESMQAMTLYFPAYSVTKMGKSNGMIIVNLDDNLLTRFHQSDLQYSANLYLTDIEGNIVSTQDEVQIGQRIAFADRIKGSQGMFWQGGRLVSYQRVKDWNFYIVNEVPAWSLYQNCLGSILLLILVTLATTVAALTLARNITKRLYRPINKVVSKMNDVSRGNLGTRIELEDITFADEKMRITIAFFCDEGRKEEELSEQLMAILNDELENRPRIIWGSVRKGIENLRISYNDAVFALEHEREEFEKFCAVDWNRKGEDIFQEVFREFRNALVCNVGEKEKIGHIFERFCMAVESYSLSARYARSCCFELASSVYFARFCDVGNSAEEKLSVLMQALSGADRERACQVTAMFLENLFEGEDGEVHELIGKVKRRIHEDLADDLTVASLAKQYYVTPNYLSRLFKRVTGEGCNEYIVRKRIEQAKSLLATTTLKVGEISIMVGYHDMNYFSLAFKKHIGVSPVRYREQMQSGK